MKVFPDISSCKLIDEIRSEEWRRRNLYEPQLYWGENESSRKSYVYLFILLIEFWSCRHVTSLIEKITYLRNSKTEKPVAPNKNNLIEQWGRLGVKVGAITSGTFFTIKFSYVVLNNRDLPIAQSIILFVNWKNTTNRSRFNLIQFFQAFVFFCLIIWREGKREGKNR